MTVDVRAAGSAALLVTFGTLDEVVGFRAALTALTLPGLTEVVSGARTLLLRFDPARTDAGRLRDDLVRVHLHDRDAGTADSDASDDGTADSDDDAASNAGTPLVIPVTYDGEDLDDVARTTGRTRDELVAWHTGQVWTSAFCGFAPGFSYLIGTEPSLDVPRRPTARTAVPSGAVALAGEFSAVYPRSSPGGWQLIGRTDVAMWSLDHDPPALAPAGIRIRFVEAGPA